MKKNIRHGNMRLWMEASKDNKSMALGEVRVYWKFERRDENGEYGLLRIRYAGDYEEPDLWHLRWRHYRDYLVENLPPYLARNYPGDLQEVMAAAGRIEHWLREPTTAAPIRFLTFALRLRLTFWMIILQTFNFDEDDFIVAGPGALRNARFNLQRTEVKR